MVRLSGDEFQDQYLQPSNRQYRTISDRAAMMVVLLLTWERTRQRRLRQWDLYVKHFDADGAAQQVLEVRVGMSGGQTSLW